MIEKEFIVVWCSATVCNNHDAWSMDREFVTQAEAEAFARELYEAGENVRYCGPILAY